MHSSFDNWREWDYFLWTIFEKCVIIFSPLHHSKVYDFIFFKETHLFFQQISDLLFSIQ